MLRQLFIALGCLFIVSLCSAQKEKDSVAIDTTYISYDELLSELDALIDSLSTPRSYTVLNLGLTKSFLTYEDGKAGIAETKRKFILAPSIGYYNRSGVGIGAGASVVNDGTGMNPYQFSVSGSYDYLKSKSFITGIALTHFFTKSDLPFYTSPLQNEAYAYIVYPKLWFKPSVGFSYGWGSRNDFEEREHQIQEINLARNGFTRINTKETVLDVSLTASMRHDFYFLNVLSASDYVRLTPQVSFASGTQQFGLNQTSNTFVTLRRTGRNVLLNTENSSLDDQLYFQPISLTAFLKTEYTKGKFYLQPQLLLDYYFPAAENNFTTSFILNVGLLF